jgi:hypothetical protein
MIKMNIEVGEYVRTKDGRIGKLDEIYYAGRGTRHYGEDLDKNYYSIKYSDNNEFGRYSDEDIVNHSKNIIDLIQTGDYVNGKKVVSVGYGGAVNVEGFKFIKPNDIKTIVTKEQFNNMEYKV